MKTQLRGNCQLCGREHAASIGSVAKHGYTVKNGWFEGACNGWQYAPMQYDRTVTDKVCAKIRAECAELLQKAEDYRTGKIHPATVKPHIKGPEIPWEDADRFDRDRAVNAARHRAEVRAAAGADYCEQLQTLADKYHGQPLHEVVAATAPEPIKAGDAKIGPNGVKIVAVKVEGRKVYYRNERGFIERVSPKKWRTFADYVEPADEWEPVSPEEQERIIAAECEAIRARRSKAAAI